MIGYRDQINHALAFAAKYHAPRAPESGAMHFVAHPANVAIILAQHQVEEITIVAAILHHVLEVATRHDREPLIRKVRDKFGSVLLGIALDALEPLYDEHDLPLPWQQRKRALLANLDTMAPRALDICCADEIHQCGTTVALVERLGREYLHTIDIPAAPLLLGWYGDLHLALTRRVDWSSHALSAELRTHAEALALVLGSSRK